MYPLCRHIMPSSQSCGSPAVKGTLFCYNHGKVRATLAEVEPRPDPSGVHVPLPFTFPEDRAALQLNFSVIVNALNDQRITLQAANTFNRLFRSCEINLSHGPLTDPGNSVRSVVLTPDGDEISEPRSLLEPGESPLAHGRQCPCQACAESYRDAPPEQHHQSCQCGLCEPGDIPAPALA